MMARSLSMMGGLRVALVDPTESSRLEIQKALAKISPVWVVGSFGSYADGVRAAIEGVAPLTLVNLDTDERAGLEAIQEISRANPRSIVLPLCSRCDGDLVLRALRAGAREFLTLPLSEIDFHQAVDRLGPQVEAEAVVEQKAGCQVIAVTGATGGVGSTTMAVNLAATIAKLQEQSVALVDLDLLLGSVDISLDILSQHNVFDLTCEVGRLDLTLVKRALTRHNSGVYVLPSPNTMEDAAKVDPESLRQVLDLLKQAFSVVVLDTSKGFQATDFVAFDHADAILLVVQLDLCCVRNTTRLLQSLRQLEGYADRVKIVANRVGSSLTEISVKKAEETLGIPIHWQVPNASYQLDTARSRGVPLDAIAPSCRAQRIFQDIARDVMPQATSAAAKAAPKRAFASFFF